MPNVVPTEGGPVGAHIGIFGGTFNPIHRGHLQAARAVMARFSFSSILFVPASVPPHKALAGVAPAAERLEMIRIAITHEPGFAVSDVELRRDGPSYTIDTVAHLQAGASRDTRYYLVVGLDAFLEMDTWKSYGALIRRIPLVVMARPDTARPGGSEGVRRDVLKFLRTKISSAYAFLPETGAFSCTGHPSLRLMTGGMRPLSATHVRELIRRGGDIDTLVPTSVGAYIRKKGLYR